MAPKRGRRPRPSDPIAGERANPLSLLHGYKTNPDAFKRDGPPSEPPLPLKFTCRGCGGRVDPESGVCAGCKTTYDF